MDWEDFKVFVKEHWKIFLGVGLSVIVVVVAIILALVFTLGRDNASPTPTVSFKGPEDINGDPPKSNSNFSFPQIITCPSTSSSGFCATMFVHQAGYVCCSAQTTSYPVLYFYNTNLAGNLIGPTSTINLDFLPSNYVVCNGDFAPIYNVANEVYYLFISVGPQVNNNKYATHVLMYTLNTNPQAANALKWVQGNISTLTAYTTRFTIPEGGTVVALKIPVTDDEFIYKESVPYYGTFGDKIQVVLDDNESLVKQSLYVSGSEYSAQKPGGNIYWFLLSDNSPSPNLNLVITIQDAKLLLLQQQTAAGQITCPVPVKTAGTYINSFGSDFFVSSGNGKNNILVVANSTNEDYCALQGVDQPAAPRGYVQGFIYNGTWVQPEFSTGNFKYRYSGTLTDPNIKNNGFAYSVGFMENNVVIGQAASPNTTAPQNAEFLVYPWVEQPLSAGTLNLLGTITPGQGVGGTDSPFVQTSLYPVSTNIQRYNLFSQETLDGTMIMVTTWNNQAGDVISILDPVVPGNQPFATFDVLQNIGASISSNVNTNPVLTRSGFGQFAGTWLSRTGNTIRLAMNDNYYDPLGRLIVMTKTRTS